MRMATILLVLFAGYLAFRYAKVQASGTPIPVDPYDLNKDGKVDQADVALLQSVYGAVNPQNPLSVAADFDRNGVVNILDYGQLALHATR